MIDYLEWIGAVCGIAAAALVAANVRHSPWGWWLYLASSFALIIYSIANGLMGVLALNLAFVITNSMGIIRIWIPYMRNKK